MDFKIGYSVKPKEITDLGIVIFEEFAIGGEIGELVDVLPTQSECEAYGFNWSGVVTGTDKVCTINTKRDLPEPNNLLYAGVKNVLGNSVDNTLLVGREHFVEDFTNNTIIAGDKAEATASNSIVLGGNAPDDNLAERQTTTLMYGLQTTDGNTKASYLNNINANFFTIPDNTAMYFHADVLAVRVGGTATGNPGDFLSWVERGVVINKSGVLSIQRERDTIKGFGNHTTWRPTGAVSGTNFVMNVRGAADTIIEWVSTIRFTEIRTGVAL